jgi:hypothetical protein
LAALEQGVPVIAVKGNKNAMRNDLDALPWARNQLYRVENYWEAAGVMMALKAGIPPASVRRPIAAAELLDRATEHDEAARRDLELNGSFLEAARLLSSG